VLPSGGKYVSGEGQIGGGGGELRIEQNSATGIIDWKSFSIDHGGIVTIDNGSGATLNRVTGGDPSKIAGRLSATGSIFLIDPHGVVVTSTGRIVAGGNFSAATSTAKLGGGSAALGARVENAGTIVADNVTLGGGDVLAGGAISVRRGGHIWLMSANRTSVTGTVNADNPEGHGGTIVATGAHLSVGPGANLSASGTTGGTVLLGGEMHGGVRPADDLVERTVATAKTTEIAKGAVIRADGTAGRGGNVVVWSDNRTRFEGLISAKAAKGRKGGEVETSGHRVTLGGTVDAGTNGTWSVDPTNLTIDGAAAATIDGSLNSGTSVAIKTTQTGTSGPGNSSQGPGNIILASSLSWTSNARLTLSAYNSILVNAPIDVSGTGKLTLTTGTGTSSGDYFLRNDAAINFAKRSSSLIINGNSYKLERDVASLAADIANYPQRDYALMNDYDAGADGVYSGSPIGYFSGVFEGLGHAISNLSIMVSDVDATGGVGLFNYLQANGVIRDIAIKRGDINDQVSGEYSYAGLLVGVNYGMVEYSYSTGKLKGLSSTNLGGLADLGGLVGQDFGKINYSHSAASISEGAADGGLVGNLSGGTVLNSYATGGIRTSLDGAIAGGLIGFAPAGETIRNSHASGNVVASGAGSTEAGGLIGQISLNSTVDNSYALGDVSGQTAGGLIGYSVADTTNSFARGNVQSTGAGAAGGLVGHNSGPISQSYATGEVSAASGSYAGGLVGIATDEAGSYGYDGRVTDAYATGSVTGTTMMTIGGLVGEADGVSIANVYSTGAVSSGSGSSRGGLIGYDNTSGHISNAYWDVTTSGIAKAHGAGNIANDTGIKGATTATLQSQLPHGFSSAIWSEDPSVNSGLPYLKALLSSY
jgi:filamentous hemagglutinin family protein